MKSVVSKANPEFHSDEWFDDLYSQTKAQRMNVIQDTLKKVDKDGESYVKAFETQSEFIKPQFIPYIYYVPLKNTLEGRVKHMKFDAPLVAKKHKRLPLILGITETIAGDDGVVPIEYVSEYVSDPKDPTDGVKQVLQYAKTLSKMSRSKKDELAELLLEGIESYRKENQPKSKGWFSDYLRSNKDYELMGFALNHSYLNVDPSFGDTKAFWIHGWGTPMLLYKHKKFPFVMITGPSLRLDENVMGDTNMIGFTG